jgi:hypothetical protein
VSEAGGASANGDREQREYDPPLPMSDPRAVPRPGRATFRSPTVGEGVVEAEDLRVETRQESYSGVNKARNWNGSMTAHEAVRSLSPLDVHDGSVSTRPGLTCHGGRVERQRSALTKPGNAVA